MLERGSLDFIAARRWYADGEPRWKQGRQRKPAKTSKQARKERRKLVKVLRRHGKDNDSALRLADTLENCSKKHRCLSGACPECARAFQRRFVSAASSVVSRKSHWHVVSLVWRQHRFAEGKLDSNTMFERLRRHFRAALKAAAIRLAIGGFDISMNEHQDGKFVSHWRPHAWILGKDHAADDFDRRNNVAVERRRSHGSVTHGRQRLDAEEEPVGERARPHIGNTTWRRKIEQSEDDIDAEFQSYEGEREFLPAQFDRDMIGIPEVVA
jgi:hypothetical protein